MESKKRKFGSLLQPFTQKLRALPQRDCTSQDKENVQQPEATLSSFDQPGLSRISLSSFKTRSSSFSPSLASLSRGAASVECKISNVSLKNHTLFGSTDGISSYRPTKRQKVDEELLRTAFFTFDFESADLDKDFEPRPWDDDAFDDDSISTTGLQFQSIVDDTAPVLLSSEQQRVVDLAMTGVSLFFTGCAGTGKSVVLREIVRQMREIHPPNTVFVTAPTGLAAVNVGGITIHSFAGLGLSGIKGGEGHDHIACKIKNSLKARDRWRRARVLVIDEVSMLSGELFDRLEAIARSVRDDPRPFGGLQVILCGDFLQLPPVMARQLCFEAASWNDVIKHAVELKEVHRQKGDARFLELLAEVRVGSLSDENRALLEERLVSRIAAPSSVGASDEPEIEPTRLYSRRIDVAEENHRRLEALPGDGHLFEAVDQGREPYLSQLDEYCPAPRKLYLKRGAQVMLLKNLDTPRGLVNGARGVIINFEVVEEAVYKPLTEDTPDNAMIAGDEEHCGMVVEFVQMRRPIVRFACGISRSISRCGRWTISAGGRVGASRSQIPLGYAWALSIHKSQGMTIERVETELGKIFQYGQAYVALSRATSLAGLRLLDLDVAKIRAHPRALEFYRSLQRRAEEYEHNRQQRISEELRASEELFDELFST